MRKLIAGVLVLPLVALSGKASPVDEIPTPFAPFEHMVGAWKGTAAPAANKSRGGPSRMRGPGSSRRGNRSR